MDVILARDDGGSRMDSNGSFSAELNTSAMFEGSRPSTDAPPTFIEKSVELFLMKAVLPVIIFVGTAGNTLSIAVLLRARMRSTSVYFYLMVLAFADLGVLYISGFKTWIRLVTNNFEILHVSNFACKTTFFLLLFSLNFSAWLVVLTTVDRFIAVWFPFRAAIWCSVRRARLLTLALMVVTCLSNGHVFWTMSIHHTPRRTYCGGHPNSTFMHGPFEYLKLASYSMLPFIIILTLNILIITRLKWSAVFLGKQDSSSLYTVPSCNPTAALGRHAKITYMLLSVSFTYLLLTGPFTIFTLATPKTTDQYEVARLMMVKAFFFLMMYCNHAVNFFLYCLTGRKFRYELKELFTGGCKKKRKVSIYTGNQSTKTQPTHMDMVLQEATL